VDVLRRCYELLRENGELILSVDCLKDLAPELQKKHDEDHAIAQRFEKATLEAILTQAGFRHVDVHPILRSRVTMRIYSDGVRRGFSYGLAGIIWRSLVIRVAEAISLRKQSGLYLVAHCQK
jgi:hypothetical protein